MTRFLPVFSPAARSDSVAKALFPMKDPSVHGDMYAAVQIQVPRNLSPEAKQKLREFEKIVAA